MDTAIYSLLNFTHVQDTVFNNLFNIYCTMSRKQFYKAKSHGNSHWAIQSYDMETFESNTQTTMTGVKQIRIGILSLGQIQFFKENCKKLKVIKFLKLYQRDFQEQMISRYINNISEMSSLEELEFMEINSYLLERILQQMKHLKRISIQIYGQNNLDWLEERSRHLESISLQYSSLKFWNDKQKQAIINASICSLSKFQNLKSLQINFDSQIDKDTTEKLFNVIKGLKDLKIYWNQFQNGQFLILKIGSLEQLESLSIFDSQEDNRIVPGKQRNKRSKPEAILSLKSNIKQFYSHYFESSPQKFYRFFQNNPNIKSISLSQNFFGDECIEITKQLALQRLSIPRSSRGFQKKYITKIGIRNLINYHPKLLAVNFNECEHMNQECLMMLSELKELIELRVYGCRISNRGMIYLKRLKKLTQLQINRNHISLAVLVSAFLNMRVLCHYVYTHWIHLIQDRQKQKKLHENVNSATKIWLDKQ